MPDSPAILFVCLHGAAKSLIAARYCERLAEARGIRISCASAGLEPDSTVPPDVVAGLAADGIDVAGFHPGLPTERMVTEATHVVALGCDLAAFSPEGGVVRWEDVPAVSDGYVVARDAIVERVERFMDEVVLKIPVTTVDG